MKKLSAFILVIVLMLTFSACGSKTTNANVTGSTPSSGSEAASKTDSSKSSSAANSDLQYIKDKGVMLVGITDYEPMDYKGTDGNWTGFDAEYAQAVAEKIGVTVKFVEIIDWDSKVLELNSKSLDVVWNGMTITDELKKSMSITDPYVTNAQVVVTKADKADKYKDVNSLKTLKFAVESGSAGQNAASDNGLTFTAVAAQSDALMEVESGSADACIIDITMANAMTGEGTSYKDLKSAMSLTEEEYGVGCRLGSDLCAKINEATKELKADGTLKKLADKYKLTLAS